MTDRLLQIHRLKQYFPLRSGVWGKTVHHIQAVDGVSLYIRRGETLGLAGESGCGKSTLGKAILRIIPGAEGEVTFDGSPNLLTLSEKQFHPFRKKMQMIFQDPYSSLNPRMTVGAIIQEPIRIHRPHLTSERQRENVLRLLQSVGLNPDHLNRYPHQFSGGQRQRIGIARALSVEPQLIIADEAVSALDVSVQAQVINLLMDLKEQLGLAYLFIAHDLSVVRHISDRVAVMYAGKIVETAPTPPLFQTPKHPYTLALLQAVPVPDPHQKVKRVLLQGEVPSPIHPPTGCRFHPRCGYAFEPCSTIEPTLQNFGGHEAACHLYDPSYRNPVPRSIHDVPVPRANSAVSSSHA